MNDEDKSKAELMAELQALREQVATLKQNQGLSPDVSISETSVPPAIISESLASFSSLSANSEKTNIPTILIVSSSELERQVYREFITIHQPDLYHIIEEKTGKNALAICRQNMPDILLIDSILYDMNGVDFLRQLQQQTRRNIFPVIVLLGECNIEFVLSFLKSGARDCLDKSSITPEKLQQAIAEVLLQTKIDWQQQWQQKRKQLISKTAFSIRESLKLDDILNTTVTEVRKLLNTDRVIVYKFLQPEWDGLVITESVVAPVFSILNSYIKDECFATTWVEPYRQGRTHSIDDIYAADITPCYRDFLDLFQIRANLVVPILQKDNLWGLLIAHHCTGARHWTADEIDLMSQLATHAGIAIQQASLIEQLQTQLTEKQQAEASLRQMQEMFRQLAENIEDIFFICTADYQQMIYINPAYETIYQQPVTSLYEQPFSFLNIIHPEDINTKLTGIQNIIKGHTEHWQEFRIIRADGSMRWIYSRTFAVRNEAGEIYRIVGLASDITELKQADFELQQLNNELEQRITERTAQLVQANQDLQRELLQREQLQRELIEREKLLDYFFQASSLAQVGLCIFDQNLRVLKVNQALADMDAYPIEAILGKTVGEILPEFAPTIEPLLQSVLDSGEPIPTQEVSGTVPSQTGVLRYWLISYFPIFAGANYPVTVGCIVIEITERKRMEAEREKLIDILDASSDIIGTAKLDGQIEYLNKAGRGMFGLAENTPVNNLRIADTAPQWAFEILREIAIPTAMRDGVWIGETAFLRHDGREIPISQLIIAHTFGTDKVQLISTIARDITEQKQIEAQLRESHRRWQFFLDNVQLIVVGLDSQGYVEYINQFFLKITQFAPEEVLGKHWVTNFIPDYLRPTIDQVFQENFQKKINNHHQNTILTKSGEERMIAWSNTILNDIYGELIGVICIGEDITERYRLERMKAEFIAVVSHELRTPLTSMQAALSLLHQKIIDPNSAEGQTTIEIAAEGVDRLVRLVNDILDLERLESGKIKLEKSIFDSAKLISSAVAQMQEMANQMGITLDVTPQSFEVDGDFDRLQQVLINLLSNAIKFSPEKSTVWLRVQRRYPATVGAVSTPELLFTVRDKGRGIPADSLERIFKSFYQVDASDSREKGGTGLGLAISHSIIKQHQGEMWVESVLGEGSSFYFTIPILENNSDEK